MKKKEKEVRIHFRINPEKKRKWKKKYKEKGFKTLTDFIIFSVDNRRDYSDLFQLADKEFGLDNSIGNNLNQLVKWVHINQTLNDEQLGILNEIIQKYKMSISVRDEFWNKVYSQIKKDTSDS